MDDVREKVIRLIVEHILPEGDTTDVTTITSFRDSGILDSLSTLKLLEFLEETFGIEFGAEDLDEGSFSNIASIERLIMRRQESGDKA